jgi:Dihaem cytochrome c
LAGQRLSCTLKRASPRIGLALALLCSILFVGACERPLPEANTAAAQLYTRRCGQCHHPYSPGSLTAAMWGIQVPLMETKMRQNRLPPLSDQERDTIMDYLTRNAENH